MKECEVDVVLLTNDADNKRKAEQLSIKAYTSEWTHIFLLLFFYSMIYLELLFIHNIICIHILSVKINGTFWIL